MPWAERRYTAARMCGSDSCLRVAVAVAAALTLVTALPDPGSDRPESNCTLTIDVRRAANYAAGHLGCSLNFPR